MLMFKKLIYSVVLLSFIVLQGCSSVPEYVGTNKNYSNIPTDIKYIKINKISSDIIQYTDFDGFIQTERFNSLIKDQMEYYLSQNNMLSKGTDLTNTLEVNITIDFIRHFMGDLTPFPARVISSPEISSIVSMNHMGKEVFYKHRKTREIRSQNIRGWTRLFKDNSDENIKIESLRDILNINTVARDLVLYLSYNIGKDTKSLNLKANKKRYPYFMDILAKSSLSNSSNPTIQYIPSSIATNYINQLKEADNSSEKIKIYKTIYKERLNTFTLFYYIRDDLLAKYEEAKSDNLIDELEWAIKVLASSGDLGYYVSLLKVKSNPLLKEEAEDSIRFLNKKYTEGQFVHHMDGMVEGRDWKHNQYVNMLNSNRNNLMVEAVKIIYREKLYEDYFLDAIKNILLNESTKNRYRTKMNTDAYAWMCRILGTSNKVKYKETLDTISRTAISAKVRAYAVKYADELE